MQKKNGHPWPSPLHTEWESELCKISKGKNNALLTLIVSDMTVDVNQAIQLTDHIAPLNKRKHYEIY